MDAIIEQLSDFAKPFWSETGNSFLKNKKRAFSALFLVDSFFFLQ